MMTKTWSDVKPLIHNPKQELIEKYEKEHQYTPDSILTFNMNATDWDGMFLLTDEGLVAISRYLTLEEMVERGIATLPEVGLGQKYKEDTAIQDNRTGGHLMSIKQYAALMEWKD